MNIIEIFDFFRNVQTINVHVVGNIEKKIPEKQLSEMLSEMSSCFHYSTQILQKLFEYINFSKDEISPTNWPITTLNEWNNFFRSLENSIRTGDPNLEKYWTLSFYMVILYGTEIFRKDVEIKIREILFDVGISNEKINNIINFLYSEKQIERKKGLNEIHTQLRYIEHLRHKTKQNDKIEDIESSLNFLIKEYNNTKSNNPYSKDLIKTLEEIIICFKNDCYIAVLSLSGKILEVCLKNVLISNGIDFDKNWMVGALIKKIKESNTETYIYDALKNIVNIINESRITAVHAHEDIPVPSNEQTKMVIYAMIDIFKRTLLMENSIGSERFNFN